jgi:nitroreductase
MYKPFANADSTFRLLEPVQRAPSVFNTQPWWFRILADDRLDVCARVGEGSAYQHLREHGLDLRDADRRLVSVDPASRELIMSCGAALCNLRLAVRAAGHDLTVHLLPYPQDSSVLATVEILTSSIHPPTFSQQELYDSIPRRHSDRWPFGGGGRRLGIGDPVPPSILAAMELAAAKYEIRLRVLSRPEIRRWLREAGNADSRLREDGEYVAELSRWTHGGEGDSGLPAAAFGPARAPHRGWRKTYPPVRNFRSSTPTVGPGDPGQVDGSAADLEPNGHHEERFEPLPQLMLLSTKRNQPLDWLRAGQALQHALLTATRYGVSASFLTQPFELRDHDAHPRPGEYARPDEVPVPTELAAAEFAAVASSVSAAHPDALRSLPSPKREPGLRRRPAAFPDCPQMVIRVGYATHDAVITRREDPDVLDCRCDPPRWLVRGTGADPG